MRFRRQPASSKPIYGDGNARMSDDERDLWRQQRSVGSVLVFGALVFGLRFAGFTPIVCLGAAAVMAGLHFLVIGHFMKRTERGERGTK